MKKLKSYPIGIHPREYKELTNAKAIRKMPLPREVVIPLAQHIGAPCEPIVAVGDKVKAGTLIAKSDKFVSAPIHSSISGTVKAIENRPHPVSGLFKAIIIESDGLDEREELTDVTAQDIVSAIRSAGIVGMGGATFPTSVKLSPPKGKKIDHFILNGTECEPYLTCDHRIMLEKPLEIIEGMKLLMKALKVDKGSIAIEVNKKDAISKMQEAVSKDNSNIEVVPLKVQYPQGAEKQLIKTITNQEVPSGGLPLDVGVVVNNVGTALAVYEAIVEKKPLYERVVTVTGDNIKQGANLLVRVGTLVKDLIKECGGLKEEGGKFIIGGPMMGMAQDSLELPVMKGTSGILLLTNSRVTKFIDSPCIRCARCIDNCPMKLVPTEYAKLSKAGKWDTLKEYNILDCIECGCCTYICPARIPIVQLVKLAKAELKKLG